jgi:hypothetical protein
MLRGFWNKAKKVIIPALPLIALVLLLAPLAYAAGHVVNAIPLGAGNEGVNFPYARNTFYAEGRHWAFFVGEDGGVAIRGYYSSSQDGEIWTTATSIGDSCLGEDMACWFDGTNVHYVRCDSGNDDYPIYYRSGVPNSDGTITWAAAEQEVVAGAGASVYYWGVSIATNSTGCPYIAYTTYNPLASVYNVTVTASSDNAGTWSTDPNLPFTFNNPVADNSTYCAIVPLSDSMMYFVYAMPEYEDDSLFGYLYEHAVFTNQTVVADSLDPDKLNHYSVVADDDDNIHMVYRADGPLGADRISYAGRTWAGGSWIIGIGGIYGGVAGESDDAIVALGKDGESNLVCTILDKTGANGIVYKRAPIADPDGHFNDNAAVFVDDAVDIERITSTYASASPFGMIWNGGINVYYDYFYTPPVTPAAGSTSAEIPTGLVLFMNVLPLIFVAIGITMGIYFISQGALLQGIIVLAICVVVIAVGAGLIVSSIPR